MGIFDKFKIGLSKSSKNFSDGFKNLVINKKIDPQTLNELEDFLIESENLFEMKNTTFRVKEPLFSTPRPRYRKKRCDPRLQSSHSVDGRPGSRLEEKRDRR